MVKTHRTLLSRLRDGHDQGSWREFDERYRDLVLRYCSRLGLQLADAEDVRQSVMISLTRALQDFRYDPSQGRFRDYLGRMVRNAATELWRKRSRAMETSLDSARDTPAESKLEHLWEQEWVSHHYRMALSKLRVDLEPQSMEVFQALMDGQSVQGIAEQRGLSVDAIYKIKQRAKDRLRREVMAQIRDTEFPERAATDESK